MFVVPEREERLTVDRLQFLVKGLQLILRQLLQWLRCNRSCREYCSMYMSPCDLERSRQG